MTSGGSENVFSTGHFNGRGFSLLDMGVTVDNPLHRNFSIGFFDEMGDRYTLAFNPDVCDDAMEVDVMRRVDGAGDLEDIWTSYPTVRPVCSSKREVRVSPLHTGCIRCLSC